MNILCLGDIVGSPGRQAVRKGITKLINDHNIDFVIANAENAAGGSGLTSKTANQLLSYGCDILSLGDHVWDQKELIEYLEGSRNVIRPYNFPKGTPGKGYVISTSSEGVKIAVISLLGRVFMRYNTDCPFLCFDKIYEEVKNKATVIIVDLHAEATSEKVAFGHYADGRASAVVGTHTHIQTADEKILKSGTAYITDLGMTGPHDSVIGQDKEKILKRFLTSMPVKFNVAEEEVRINGALIEVDEKMGKANRIRRINIEIV